MMLQRLALMFCAALLPGTALAARDCAAPAAVCEARGDGGLALIERGTPLPVLVDAGDFTAVQRAAQALRDDLAAVAGNPADGAANSGMAVIAGTLGHSARIDRIVRDRAIDTTGVGSAVNLEIDVVARYVERLLEQRDA